MKINSKSDLKEALNLKKYKVKEGKSVRLKSFETNYQGNKITKEESDSVLAFATAKLAEMQDKLYAENKHSLLIILQAMDAAGKDGTVKHVLSGLNPAGVKVSSFKTPSTIELDHDYFWRHYKELPERGDIGIFNRSHYENVIVTKVHPEYILGEKLPDINNLKDIDEDFWDKRYKQIRNFERTLTENGTLVLKIFLHVSKDEQKRRLIERIDNPTKNWKFSVGDVKERAYWKEYQQAYEDMINSTNTKESPWYIVPADDKWFARLLVSTAIFTALDDLHLSYPTVSANQLKELQEAKKRLLAE